MNALELIENYPLLFKEYFERYAKLSHGFLQKFNIELTWGRLSFNQNIEWDHEFIELCQDRIYWPYFIDNPALKITLGFIKKYSKRIELDRFLSNPEIVNIDEIFTKYTRLRLFIDHPLLNDRLKEKYRDRILDDNRTRKRDSMDFAGKSFTLQHGQLMAKDQLEHFDFDKLVQELELYLNEDFIEEFMKKMNPNFGEFGYLKPRFSDSFGLTPGYYLPEDLFLSDRKLDLAKIRTIDYVPLHQESSLEGKFRLLHCLRIYSYPNEPSLIVSDKFCELILSLSLPDFEQFSVKIITKKGDVIFGYNLLVFQKDSIYSGGDIDMKVKVKYYSKTSSGFVPVTLVQEHKPLVDLGTNNEVWDYFSSRKALGYKAGIVNYKPLHHNDIYTYGGKFLVGKEARIKIENSGFGPFKWESVFPSTIVPAKSNNIVEKMKVVEKIKPPILKESPEDLFYKEKAKRIMLTGIRDVSILESDTYISDIERNLKFLFPNEFRQFLADVSSMKVNTSNGAEEFTVLLHEDIEIINDYYERYPRTYRCCSIAGNGVGDYIALLLKKDSDYQLSSNLVLLNHETGEVEAVTASNE